MAGLAIAALLGSGAAAAAGTAALVSSAATGAQLIGSTISSFSQARKARERGEKAKAEVKKRMEEAKRRVDVNTAEQLSVPKEPYQLMRMAGLTSAATGLQAGVEGESRGAAATAGRVQMAQQQQEAEIAAAQSERMFEVDQLKAEEEARIQQQLAGIALEEAAGAQQALRYAEEDRTAAIKEGYASAAKIGSRVLESFAGGDFADNELAGLTREQRVAARQARRAQGGGGQTFGPGESASQLLEDLARGPEVDLGSGRQQRRSANQSVGVLAGQGGPVINTPSAIGGTLDFVTGYDVDGIPGSAYQDYVPPGRTLSPAETRQLNRANREIATANRQNQRELERLEGQPILPTQRQLDMEMTQQRRLGQQDARDIQRVLDADARERGRQQQPGLPPPMTLTEELSVGGSGQFNPFRGEQTPVSRQELEERITRNARLEGAGPVDTSPAGPINTDVLMDAEIRRATERRGGMSFIPNDPLAADMAAFYGEDPPVRTPVGPRMEETGGGDPMKAGVARTMEVSNVSELLTALESDKIPQTPQNEELRVSLGGAQDTTALLAGLRDIGVVDAEIVAPTTPQTVEASKADVAKSAAGESAEVRSAVERVANSVDSKNPVPIALQWLGIKEVNTKDSKPDPDNPGDSIVINIDVDKALKANDEGAALLTAIWQNVGLGADTTSDFIASEQAWCGGFVNHVLTEGGFDTKVEGTYNKMRADSYAGLGTKIYVSEKAEKYYTKTGRVKERNGGKVLASGNPMNAKVGDVVVKDSGKNRHVGFFVGYDDDGNVLILGGNQHNEVNITRYPVEKIWAVRRVTSGGLNDDEKNKLSEAIAGGTSTSGKTL